MTLLVTGAAGFIGSNLVRHLRKTMPETRIVSLDVLGYAGHEANLRDLADDAGHVFVRGDVADADLVDDLFARMKVRGVLHLAAESHVDRSIEAPLGFVRSNVLGTVVLLEAARRHWAEADDVRFHHVSTDEVFGSAGEDEFFSEDSPYEPRNPYAASKAASDHFVRAWHETHGLPVVVTNCTNNYGPYQFPEKLIPLAIRRAVAGDTIPVYGDGHNIRDWLFVRDHCEAISAVFRNGRSGETYCVGGGTPLANRDLVHRLCDILDPLLGRRAGETRSLIQFVKDRPGHDDRYAMDASKIEHELGWKASTPLDDGLRATAEWYLSNAPWIDEVVSDDHDRFQAHWYAERGSAT